MAAKTGFKMIPTMIAAAVVIIVAMFVLPHTTNGHHDAVTLVVLFSPSPRGFPIHVTYSIGMGLVANEYPSASPWQKVVTREKGQMIALGAEQVNHEEQGWLQCAIHQKGKTPVVQGNNDPRHRNKSMVICTT